MSPLNDSSVGPFQIGREAAEAYTGPQGGSPLSGDGTLHQPGDDLGRKAVEAYRYSGMEGLRDVIKEYQDGYNVRAKQLGAVTIKFEEIKSGILWAMPGLDDEEKAAIHSTL